MLKTRDESAGRNLNLGVSFATASPSRCKKLQPLGTNIRSGIISLFLNQKLRLATYLGSASYRIQLAAPKALAMLDQLPALVFQRIELLSAD
jgi:hypothetical protein